VSSDKNLTPPAERIAQLSQNCTHEFISTTSDHYMKCSKCGAVCKAKYGVPYQLVNAAKAQPERLSWTESERKMLNKLYRPNYADYAKAESDLRNYWK
jgi:hypothetical protein